MLTNFKSPTGCTDFCRFSQYIPFLAPGFIMGRARDICGKKCLKMSKKVQFGPPFLLEGWMTLLWGGRIFQGSTSCALFVWKMSFEIPIFCLDKLINSCQGWELFVQEFWTGLKLYSQSSTVFQKNAMKMKMLFSIQPNDLGFWCIQLMHSNFEFSDAPDPKCLGAPRALLVFWSKKILSETDCLVLVSVWQIKLGELEIASLKDHLNYPWIGFSLPVEKWLQSWFKLNSMISFVLAYAWLRLRLS